MLGRGNAQLAIAELAAKKISQRGNIHLIQRLGWVIDKDQRYVRVNSIQREEKSQADRRYRPKNVSTIKIMSVSGHINGCY